jgi:hypothetical protein
MVPVAAKISMFLLSDYDLLLFSDYVSIPLLESMPEA